MECFRAVHLYWKQHTMTSQQILSSDVIDILFEHRNKQYGAYRLRKDYPKELWKAVVVAVSFVFLLVFFIQPSAAETLAKPEEGNVVIVEHFVPPVEKKQEPPQQQKQMPKEPVRQVKAIDQFTFVDKEVVDPLPTQDMMLKAAISDINTVGTDVGHLQPTLLPEAKGSGNAVEKEPAPAKELIPDKQPQFPGGAQAWLAFLSRHLMAPEPLESGEKRTVLIRFYVAEDGSITNFRVMQSAGAAFDNEVIRVLRKMPKWTPAIQGGRSIPVSFTQPVTFVGLEE
ncbi:MAG TPA: energy transducer TonB [Flavisolibacter sp.]